MRMRTNVFVQIESNVSQKMGMWPCPEVQRLRQTLQSEISSTEAFAHLRTSLKWTLFLGLMF